MHALKMQCYLILAIALNFAAGSFPDRDTHESDKNSIGSIEYCYQDLFFEPRCASDEVIVIRSAHFGRMQKGRCIKDDFGFIGCSADILAFLDNSCSGRRSCQLAIVSLTENINSSCPIGLVEYLEVDHECVEVAYPSKGYCDSGSSTHVGNQNGYLSSLVTQETGCGSKLTPWRVIAKPGQRIGIRLLYFGYRPLNTFSGKSECVTYVTVEEKPTRLEKSLCYDNNRESSLYIYQSNDVELHLTPNLHEQENNYFLVQYEVFGCADMDPPDNGWMQRLGDDLQRGCNESSEADVTKWLLQCNGSHWVGNDYKCAVFHAAGSTPVPVASTTQKRLEESAWVGTTSTMSIIVIAGLAVVVFLCIALSAMAVYIVRSRKRERMPPKESTTPNYKTQTRPSLNARQTAVVDDEGKRASATESDQYWSWQKQRRDPYGCDDDPCDGRQSGTMCSVKSHQCRLPEESTILVRNVDNGRGRYYTGRRAPEYDRLEPGLMEIPCGETPTDHIA